MIIFIFFIIISKEEMMKANLNSSGFVNLLLCLHCGAFPRFASFGIASAPKSFLARVEMETQHVNKTRPVAWWENVTALACLCKNPFGPNDLFLFCIPSVLFSRLLFLSWFSKKFFFPDTLLCWLPLFLSWFLCCDYGFSVYFFCSQFT